MRVGTVREIKNHEYRVGLTPESARELAAHGHDVWVETGAGNGIGAGDADYEAAGATIKPDAATIFAGCEMIVKVKEPQAVERAQLREGQVLYTYLHLAPDPEQTADLVKSGVTAIAYETVTGPGNALPLLKPMSQVAGRMSIQAGATALERARAELLRRIEEERSLYDTFMQRLTMLCHKGLLMQDTDPQLVVDGASNLIGLDLHLTREKTRDLFRALEEKKRVVALLENDLQVPVVHASICQAWQIHKHLMVRETAPGYGRLLAELP